MSQEKAQLIAPIGIMTVSGVTATGVITATSFSGNVVGSAKSLVNGSDISTGVITATSFVGNLTGNIQRLADSAPDINVGVTTATSFVGNLTGSVTDLTSAPNITVGVVTATTFEGPVTGNVTGNATGLAGELGVNYNGGWTGAGTSQINAGVVTATSFYGDGSNLDGVSSGPVSSQSIGITSATTSIDLSNGNVIHATQSADTTVSFANTSNGNVYFIRTKDDNTTARTITWPTGIGWSGGQGAPTLIQDNPRSTDAQVFLLVTRDMGLNWYGKEVVRADPQTHGVFGVGKNDYGQLGLNNTTNYSSPVQLSGTNWKSVGISGLSNGSCFWGYAVKTDGTAWAWGRSNHGQLAQNNLTQYSSPIQIGTDTNWSKISVANNAGAALKTDNTLWVWGYGANGQLGINVGGPAPTLSRSSPIQLPGTTWSNVFGGETGSMAVKSDGTFWIWGMNSEGRLGLNNPYPSQPRISSPTQVGTDTNWSSEDHKINEGQGCLGAVKTDGTLWTWGNNDFGNLGQNNTTVYSSPRQLPGTWATISFGERTAMATKADGTLWGWGYNVNGQLALNGSHPTGIDGKISSPTQVGTDTTWQNVFVGTYQVYGVKTNNTLWSWGNNETGKLGQNNETNYSSPTQVPGTNWNKVQIQSQGALLQKIES